MIKGIIAPGYNISDNCHKYTNDDSTIECYVYTREALLKPIKTTDKELNTNSVYALVGTQDDEIKVYVGQGCKARRPLHRVRKTFRQRRRAKRKLLSILEYSTGLCL